MEGKESQILEDELDEVVHCGHSCIIGDDKVYLGEFVNILTILSEWLYILDL